MHFTHVMNHFIQPTGLQRPWKSSTNSFLSASQNPSRLFVWQDVLPSLKLSPWKSVLGKWQFLLKPGLFPRGFCCSFQGRFKPQKIPPQAFFQSKCCTGAASNRAQGLELCALRNSLSKNFRKKFGCEGNPPLIRRNIYLSKKNNLCNKMGQMYKKNPGNQNWIQHG